MFRLKILILIILMFLPIKIFAVNVSADDGSTLQSEASESNDLVGQSLAVEDGSEANPYIVDNYDLLVTTLQKSIPSGSNALHINIVKDLTYSNVYTQINKNVVIDGIKDASQPPSKQNASTLNYSGTAYTTPQLYTSSAGVNITLKNINFGSQSYQGNSYWGIVQVNSTNVTLNVENINYEINYGGQPFYSSSGNNFLNFSGTNYFKVNQSGNYNQEFSEGFSTINFKEGSQTDIYQNSSESLGVFWTKSDAKIKIENNAQLAISSGKTALFYSDGSLSLDVGDNASFNYTKINGYQSGNQLMYQNKVVPLYAGQNALVNFNTNNTALNAGSLNITASDPNQVSFGSATSNPAIAAGALNFTNSGTGIYQIISETTGGKDVDPLVSSISSGNTATLTSAQYSGKTSLTYLPLISISGITASAEVDNQKSDIVASLVDFVAPSNLAWNYQANYLISSVQLKLQTEIQSAYQLGTESVDGIRYTGNSNLDSVIDNRTTTFNNILAGKYYVYGQVTATNNSSNISTNWYETTVIVPQYFATIFTKQLAFKAPTSSVISDSSDYIIQSCSNTPTNITIAYLIENSNSDSSIELVKQLSQGDANKLKLDFNVEMTDKAFSWNLLPGALNNSDQLILQPYWQSNNVAHISLGGEYSGPFNKIKNVDYSLIFNITDT
ncbi:MULTISPECIES: hypothetical protein [unclassified Enterococcus]|uniref:hypothetical protein n=1 Tax=unclassified Enterococcus TaxID=2608891 RepID=UPI001555DC9B|nr:MULTISPECIES: hypothetical protein [unclassified Enterococcus]MBS7576785.1 hypothetical protein [Enterococcus sp. MMGLQ5-2]MBS7584192.1 hypothetical protein [Enterococcus sp. MMGLQ5-1]NPD12050.1 hypothetical protein [Enterococcus sp. MMGLQ5-1]NPD36622.1 hypothetical protein [Enterococcus sp. MMGLQ5-2]